MALLLLREVIMIAPGMPDGLGFFLASGDMVRDPDETAKRLLAAGATHAWVLTSSVDNRMQPVERVAKVVGALHAHNISCGLYMFPVDATVHEHEAHLDECSKTTGVVDVLADIEPDLQHADGSRVKPSELDDHEWQAQEIAGLFARLRAKGYRLSISVFPRKRWRDYDWSDLLGPDVDCYLQLYTTVSGPVSKLVNELEFWKKQGIRTIICVGSYVGDAAAFRRDLHIAEEHSSAAQVDVWALNTTSEAEQAVALQFVVEAWPAP